MSSTEPPSRKEFNALFGLPRGDFLEPVDFIDTSFGFGVSKKSSKQGFKSVFAIYISPQELSSPNELKKVFARASFGMETSDGIVTSSSSWKRGRFDPIDIVSTDFQFDLATKKFYYKSTEIDAFEILKKLDRWHTKNVRPLFGLWLRLKIRFFEILAKILKAIFYAVSILQYLISGQWIKIFDNIKELENRYNSLPPRLNPTGSKKMKIFDYEVDTWVAIVYCLFHLAVYAVLTYYNSKPQWLVNIFSNSFLTLIYVVPTLGFANTVLPTFLKERKILHKVLVFFQKLYFDSAGRNVSVDDINLRHFFILTIGAAILAILAFFSLVIY